MFSLIDLLEFSNNFSIEVYDADTYEVLFNGCVEECYEWLNKPLMVHGVDLHHDTLFVKVR